MNNMFLPPLLAATNLTKSSIESVDETGLGRTRDISLAVQIYTHTLTIASIRNTADLLVVSV